MTDKVLKDAPYPGEPFPVPLPSVGTLNDMLRQALLPAKPLVFDRQRHTKARAMPPYLRHLSNDILEHVPVSVFEPTKCTILKLAPRPTSERRILPQSAPRPCPSLKDLIFPMPEKDTPKRAASGKRTSTADSASASTHPYLTITFPLQIRFSRDGVYDVSPPRT